MWKWMLWCVARNPVRTKSFLCWAFSLQMVHGRLPLQEETRPRVLSYPWLCLFPRLADEQRLVDGGSTHAHPYAFIWDSFEGPFQLQSSSQNWLRPLFVNASQFTFSLCPVLLSSFPYRCCSLEHVPIIPCMLISALEFVY